MRIMNNILIPILTDKKEDSSDNDACIDIGYITLTNQGSIEISVNFNLSFDPKGVFYEMGSSESF